MLVASATATNEAATPSRIAIGVARRRRAERNAVRAAAVLDLFAAGFPRPGLAGRRRHRGPMGTAPVPGPAQAWKREARCPEREHEDTRAIPHADRLRNRRTGRKCALSRCLGDIPGHHDPRGHSRRRRRAEMREAPPLESRDASSRLQGLGLRTHDLRIWNPLLYQLSNPERSRVPMGRELHVRETYLSLCEPCVARGAVLLQRDLPLVLLALRVVRSCGPRIPCKPRRHRSALCCCEAPAIGLFDDLGHDAGADGTGRSRIAEAHLLFDTDRRDELDRRVTLSPGMTIFTPSGRWWCRSRPSCACRTADGSW